MRVRMSRLVVCRSRGDYLSPYLWTGPQVPELGATSPTGILSTTEYDVSVNVNNGETVKVAEFTKLEVGGESLGWVRRKSLYLQ